MAKKYTAKVKPLNSQAFAEIKQRALRNAKSNSEIRFIQSAKFKTEINKEIKLNRSTTNQKKLTKIKEKLADDKDAQRGAQKILGTRVSVRKDGRVVKRYSETSDAQRRRLNKISRQLSSGKLTVTKIKQMAKNDKNYKENKRFLPENPTIRDVLLSLVRDSFYYENLDLIEKFNEKVGTRGKGVADVSKVGQKLRLNYQESQKARGKSNLDFIVNKVK